MVAMQTSGLAVSSASPKYWLRVKRGEGSSSGEPGPFGAPNRCAGSMSIGSGAVRFAGARDGAKLALAAQRRRR